MKAVLAAAGIGSRLQPLTGCLPKCMVPIAGQPLLGIWLGMLSGAGIKDILVNLHHHAGFVGEYLQRSPYAPIVRTVSEETLLGTGGTLLRNKASLAGGPVLFAHADNLTCFDVAAFIAAHKTRPAGTVMTMMTFDTPTPRQCGIVELDASGVVTAFHEKVANPPGCLANAAVFILEPAVLDFLDTLPAGRETIDFSLDVLPHFLGRIFTYHNGTYHRDIGSIPSLVEAQFDYPLNRASFPAPAGDPWCGVMTETLIEDVTRAMRSALATLPAAR